MFVLQLAYKVSLFTMVKKCCVVECRSNYAGSDLVPVFFISKRQRHEKTMGVVCK